MPKHPAYRPAVELLTAQIQHTNIMIELRNDHLQFFFPEIQEQINLLAEKYITKIYPWMVEQNSMRKQTNKSWIQEQYIENLLREEVARVIKRFHHNGSIFIAFERALRHPEDSENHLQAKCLGLYALRHIDDHAAEIPKSWLNTDAVMLPMLQSEALRIYFHGSYPFAIKIGQGNINAITGKSWENGLNHDSQDYLSTPKNKWINQFHTESGVLKQFVAPRLGGKAAKKPRINNAIPDNSIQIQVYPLKAEVFFRRKIEPLLPTHFGHILGEYTDWLYSSFGNSSAFSMTAFKMIDIFDTNEWQYPMQWNRSRHYIPGSEQYKKHQEAKQAVKNKHKSRFRDSPGSTFNTNDQRIAAERAWNRRMEKMRIDQKYNPPRTEQFFDDHESKHWEMKQSSHCLVHLCHSEQWKKITGTIPPQKPISSEVFAKYNLPWLEEYQAELIAINAANNHNETESSTGEK